MSFLVFLVLATHATQPEKSAFEQALEQNALHETKEQWVQYGSTRYREVEYQGQTFYVKFTSRSEEFAQLDCDPPSGRLNPSLLEGGVKIYRRSKAFVSFLKETCETKKGQRRTDVDFNTLAVGFTIPDKPNSVIKNKKVLINPLSPGMGFHGEF